MQYQEKKMQFFGTKYPGDLSDTTPVENSNC